MRAPLKRLAVLGLCLLAACATQELPWIAPVSDTPTGLHLPGKFVWTDLVTDDLARSQAFYGALFGWTFEDEGGYTSVRRDGQRIAGIVHARDAGRSEWVGNLSVADVDRAAALVAELGGIVEGGPRDAPDRGRIALVTDPEGAAVLLVRSGTGDTPDGLPPVGAFLWRELWVHDVTRAVDFYAAIAGYESNTAELDGQPYHVLMAQDSARAGVLEAPPEIDALWLTYVRVEDPEVAAARAVQLGARLVTGDEDTAILVDPVGAAFGVQAWTRREEASR